MDQEMLKNEKAVGLPWGFWLTIVFSLAIFLMSSFVQVIVTGVYIVFVKIQSPDLNIIQFSMELEGNGLYLSISTLIAAPIYIGLCGLFAKIRDTMQIREYLGLHWCDWKIIVKWIAIIILVMIGSDTLTYLLHRDIVPSFMVNIFETAGWVPLLLFVIISVAPVVEELFFRGFMFKGLQYSKVGSIGAILITSLLWSSIHLQYNLYQIAILFATGLIFGWARVKTNSIIPCIVMHITLNIAATFELVIYLKYFA